MVEFSIWDIISPPAALAALFGAIGGGLMSAVVSWLTYRREKRRRAFELFDYYALNPDSRIAWAAVGVLRDAWQDGDETEKKKVLSELVTHFVSLPRANRSREEACDNRLTPHQNVSVILHFWATVSDQYAHRLVDRRLCRTLLANQYSWNSEFLLAFTTFYQASDYQKLEKDPTWEAAIPKLYHQFRIPFPKWYQQPRCRVQPRLTPRST